MRKMEFLTQMSEEHNLMLKDSSKITKLVFRYIRKLLLEGREVRLQGIGHFSFKYKPACTKKNNLAGGELVDIPARIKLVFKTYPNFQRALNNSKLVQLLDEDDYDE